MNRRRVEGSEGWKEVEGAARRESDRIFGFCFSFGLLSGAEVRIEG